MSLELAHTDLPDYAAVLREVARVLRPGGRFAWNAFAFDHQIAARLDGEHQTQQVIAAKARLLREGAKRVLEGEPLNRIVDDWNKRGLRTRAGSRWQVKTMRRILANPWVVPILGEDTARELIRIFNQPDRQRLGRPAEGLGRARAERAGDPRPRGLQRHAPRHAQEAQVALARVSRRNGTAAKMILRYASA